MKIGNFRFELHIVKCSERIYEHIAIIFDERN